MNKIIMVLIDGLNASVGKPYMGYLQHLVEHKVARYTEVQSELPSNSRPLYETLMTGLQPLNHGILHNDIVRQSLYPNLFSKVREAGGVTAAAAYYFFSEIYNHVPFNPVADRIQLDSRKAIQYGIFYKDEAYPDRDLMADASWLISSFLPDFMLIHPMQTDTAGHKSGADSDEYIMTVRRMDEHLSLHLPDWMKKGYSVLITADHGMGEANDHGGDLEKERQVPLWAAGPAFSGVDLNTEMPQTEITGLLEQALSLI
jgi:predicted AlkP superfamily pyrophosphatase or phosphodiesterase